MGDVNAQPVDTGSMDVVAAVPSAESLDTVAANVLSLVKRSSTMHVNVQPASLSNTDDVRLAADRIKFLLMDNASARFLVRL